MDVPVIFVMEAGDRMGSLLAATLALEETAADAALQPTHYEKSAKRSTIASLQTKLIIAFGLAFVSIVTVGSLQYRTVHLLDQDYGWIAQNQEVLTELGSVRNILNRTDASVQSLVLTGESNKAGPDSASAELKERIQTLQMLTLNNPLQHRKVTLLANLTNESIRAMQAEINARNAGQISRVELLPLEDAIRKAIRGVRSVAEDMEMEQLRVLQDWRDQAQAANRQTKLFIWSGSTMALGLLCFAGVGLYLDLSQRGKAEQELEREVNERAAAQIKLQASEESLRQLSVSLLKAQDEEQRRIGRELHDSVGQCLAMLKMELDSLKFSGSRGGDPTTEEQLAECTTLTEQSIREIRTMSYLMHPPLLEELGLNTAIPMYVEGFSKRSGIQITLDIPPGFGRLPADLERAMFRVLQESLTNVHRHSGSRTARVALAVKGDGVTLEVADQGHGIPAEKVGKPGVGLQGMRERIREFGGKLEMDSGPRGTTVRVSVPQDPTTSATAASA
jgi:signal transduction histidine kinase